MHYNNIARSCQDELDAIGKKRKSNEKIIPWMRKHISEAALSSMEHCGDYLVMLEDETRTHRKLDIGFFCRQRLCSGCAWRSAVKSAQCVAAISQALIDKKRIMLMVTLTVPNVSGEQLRGTIQHIGQSWTRLLKREDYKLWSDSIRKLEITYNGKYDTYHPHLHCVIYVPSSYFARNYVSHDKLLADWRSATKQPEITQVDIRRCKNIGTSSAILEVAKYSAKASDYTQSEAVCDTMYKALHHTRTMTYAGECKRLKAEYDNNGLKDYRMIDTVKYTMRVVYIWQHIANGEWGYNEHDVQPYDMTEEELQRLRNDEERAVAYAMDTAKRRKDIDLFLAQSWAREFIETDDEVLL